MNGSLVLRRISLAVFIFAPVILPASKALATPTANATISWEVDVSRQTQVSRTEGSCDRTGRFRRDTTETVHFTGRGRLLRVGTEWFAVDYYEPASPQNGILSVVRNKTIVSTNTCHATPPPSTTNTEEETYELIFACNGGSSCPTQERNRFVKDSVEQFDHLEYGNALLPVFWYQLTYISSAGYLWDFFERIFESERDWLCTVHASTSWDDPLDTNATSLNNEHACQKDGPARRTTVEFRDSSYPTCPPSHTQTGAYNNCGNDAYSNDDGTGTEAFSGGWSHTFWLCDSVGGERKGTDVCDLETLRRAASGLPTSCTCVDRDDNDCDGAVDCDDSDCQSTELCACLNLRVPRGPISPECCKLKVRYYHMYPPDGSPGYDPGTCSPIQEDCGIMDGYCQAPVHCGDEEVFQCFNGTWPGLCENGRWRGEDYGDTCADGTTCCSALRNEPLPPKCSDYLFCAPISSSQSSQASSGGSSTSSWSSSSFSSSLSSSSANVSSGSSMSSSDVSSSSSSSPSSSSDGSSSSSSEPSSSSSPSASSSWSSSSSSSSSLSSSSAASSPNPSSLSAESGSSSSSSADSGGSSQGMSSSEGASSSVPPSFLTPTPVGTATPTAPPIPTLPPGCTPLDLTKSKEDLRLGPEALKGYGTLMVARLGKSARVTGDKDLARRLKGSWKHASKRFQVLLQRCYAAIGQLPDKYVVCRPQSVCETINRAGTIAVYRNAITELKQSEVRALNRATRLVFPNVKEAAKVTRKTGRSIKAEAKRLIAVALSIPIVESNCRSPENIGAATEVPSEIQSSRPTMPSLAENKTRSSSRACIWRGEDEPVWLISRTSAGRFSARTCELKSKERRARVQGAESCGSSGVPPKAARTIQRGS